MELEEGDFNSGGTFFTVQSHPKKGIVDIGRWYDALGAMKLNYYYKESFNFNRKFVIPRLEFLNYPNGDYQMKAQELLLDLEKSSKSRSSTRTILDWLDRSTMRFKLQKKIINWKSLLNKGIRELKGYKKYREFANQKFKNDS